MGGDILTRLRSIASEKKPPSIVIKDFEIFVSKKEQEIASEIDGVLKNIHPANNLEKLLKIRLIDRFRVASEVVSLLQSSESLNVNQALKCRWFFAELQEPEGFVRDVIPHLSLSTRNRVINKYGSLLKNVKAGEVLYLGIKSRYGTRLASSLLPVCSENFIRNELPNVKFALNPKVVMALLDKYPALTSEYLKYLADDKSLKSKRQNLSSYDRVLVKMSNRDMKSFLDLFENHRQNIPYLKLGRRATKKLIKEESEKVVVNYDTYSPILVDKTFFKRLSLDQLKNIFMSFFLPNELTDFVGGSTRKVRLNLKFIKPSLRSLFLMSTISKKYERSLADEDILFKLTDAWVDYMPEDAKMKWVEMKVQENSDVEEQAFYVSQLPVSQSIPRLKKFMESHSDPNTRCLIGKFLISTIRISQSAASIKGVIEYINQRFGNETNKFIGVIVETLPSLGPLYLQLEAEDWAPIMVLLNTLNLRGVLFKEHSYQVGQLLSHRLHNTFLKQGNAEAVLHEIHELIGEEHHHILFGLCRDTPFHARTLSLIIHSLQAPQRKAIKRKFGFCGEMLEVLCAHNKRHPDDQVEIPKWLLSFIEDPLKGKSSKEDIDLQRFIAPLKTLPNATLLVSYMKKVVVLDGNVSLDSEGLIKLMHETPDFIRRRIGEILRKHIEPKSKFEVLSPFYKKCRLYDAYGISSKITKTCLEMMTQPGIRPYCVRVLALLLPPLEYVTYVSQYAPSSSKIDVSVVSEEDKHLYQTQKAVCGSFVHVSRASDTLTLVRKFASGDYLKLVLGSFVSVCVQVPECEILKVLNESMNCPVSLKKLLLRMTMLIAPTEQKIRTIVEVFKNEKNVSLRLVLFKQLQRSLFDEPDDESFSILSSIISQLTAEDEEALKLVFDISELDDLYVTQYLEHIWNLVVTSWQDVLPEGRSKIIDLMDPRLMREMREEFCDVLVNFELSRKLPDTSPGQFVSMYLVHSPSYDIQGARLNKVMTELNPLIASSWNDRNFGPGHVFPVRFIVRDLINAVCAMVGVASGIHLNPVHLLGELKKRISQIIPAHSLQERLKLDLALACHSCTTNASAVVDLYKSHLQAYGPHHEPEIIDILVKNAPSEQHQELAVELITSSETTPQCQIVGIKLLSTCLTKEADVPRYKILIDTLLESTHSNVQAAADTFFKELTTSFL